MADNKRASDVAVNPLCKYFSSSVYRIFSWPEKVFLRKQRQVRAK